MSSEEDKARILNAMGGKKGLLDSGLPALIFLVIFNVTKDVQQAAYGALALSLILTIVRLARRETIQHAISGVIGVAICAWLSNRTGKAEDFYLPGLWTNAIYGAVYLVSILIRWPIIGVIIGPLLEENLRWRKDPLRTKVYLKATWLWVGMFAVRLLVQYPLYVSGNVNVLGTARLLMGYPLFIATAWATWLVIKNGPKLREDLRTVS
jgi:intracellular septation protein A